MSEPQLPREVRRRLAIQHAEEVTGNVAMTCRYYRISRQVYYRWLRRYQEQGVDGLRDLSRRPHHSPNATHVDVVGKILYLRQNSPTSCCRPIRPAHANNGAWNTPFEIAPAGSAQGAVAAVARTPDHLDPFWVGLDGSVGSNWWDAHANNGAWNTDP